MPLLKYLFLFLTISSGGAALAAAEQNPEPSSLGSGGFNCQAQALQSAEDQAADDGDEACATVRVTVTNEFVQGSFEHYKIHADCDVGTSFDYVFVYDPTPTCEIKEQI